MALAFFLKSGEKLLSLRRTNNTLSRFPLVHFSRSSVKLLSMLHDKLF